MEPSKSHQKMAGGRPGRPRAAPSAANGLTPGPHYGSPAALRETQAAKFDLEHTAFLLRKVRQFYGGSAIQPASIQAKPVLDASYFRGPPGPPGAGCLRIKVCATGRGSTVRNHAAQFGNAGADIQWLFLSKLVLLRAEGPEREATEPNFARRTQGILSQSNSHRVRARRPGVFWGTFVSLQKYLARGRNFPNPPSRL